MTQFLKRDIRKRLIRISIIAVGALAGFPVLLFILQRRMVYFPRRYEPSYKIELPIGAVEIPYGTSAGEQVCFYIPPSEHPDKPPARLWVLFGGNAALALDWLDFIDRYPDRRHGFLLIDYPGYGLCKGRATMKTIGESSEAAFSALGMRLGVKMEALEGDLGVMGHSLGAATGLQFAVRHPVKHIVLASPFTSLMDMARRSVGRPLCYILIDRFDNRARLNELILRPDPPAIHIFHGDADGIVPFEMGRELAESHKGKIVFHPYAGTDHNLILDVAEDEMHRVMSESSEKAAGGEKQRP